MSSSREDAGAIASVSALSYAALEWKIDTPTPRIKPPQLEIVCNMVKGEVR